MNTLKCIVFALAVFATTSVQGSSLECPLVCPDLYEPTCATDGTVFVQFDNPCALGVFNCKRQRSTLSTYAETDIDWCTTTELDQLNDNFATDLEQANPSCLKPCPMIYSPLCGSNGTYRKVFSNECEMTMFNCLYENTTGKKWRLLKNGGCSTTDEDSEFSLFK